MSMVPDLEFQKKKLNVAVFTGKPSLSPMKLTFLPLMTITFHGRKTLLAVYYSTIHSLIPLNKKTKQNMKYCKKYEVNKLCIQRITLKD